MDYATLVIEGNGPNAISPDTVKKLRADLAAADGKPVLLTGKGDVFSAGLDLKAMMSMSADDFIEFLGNLEGLGRDLFLHPAPTVACIQGHCVAGGYLLASTCERRIVHNHNRYKFGLPAVKLGLQYPPVLLRTVQYAIPREHWEDVLLGAVRVGAHKALEMGMINELADDVHARSVEWLMERAAMPREAYAATKRSIHEPLLNIPNGEMERFAKDVIPSWSDPERLARLAAAAAGKA